jgi:deoxyribodipyrimidine photo-lyase
LSTPAFEPTRSAGLNRLEAFAPLAADYAESRSYVEPGHPNVSRLSPWIRRRLVLESEVVSRVLREYPDARVDKLVQEVGWRAYWKGWLELRPQLWTDYRERIEHDFYHLSPEERDRLNAAEAGESGIECFDDWARELNDTGYLHNHVRMWFASIWIFTLGLPWPLGADWFHRQLLDGDPASNTLSWRWVAGLHTRGRHYLARAANIEKFTRGRYAPHGRLNEHAPPLSEEGVYEPGELADGTPPSPRRRTGLLLHLDDLVPEQSGIAAFPVAAAAAGPDSYSAAHQGLSERVRAFNRGALADALDRAARHFSVQASALDEADWNASVMRWVDSNRLEQVLVLDAPVGPRADALAALEPRLRAAGIALARHRRPWDSRLWPHATGGYAHFRKRLYPELEILLAGR